MSKLIPVILLILSIGGLIFVPLYGQNQIFAQEEVSERVKKLCADKYDAYKNFGKRFIQDKYVHLAYLDDCFRLFEDPFWDFNGKEKIDRQYEKYYQITAKVNPSITDFENQNLDIKTTSTIKIGYQNYALKFRICAEEQAVSEPKFFIVTDKEYYLVKGNRIVKENSCNFVMSYANLQDPGKLMIIPFDGNYMPSKYLKVKSVY